MFNWFINFDRGTLLPLRDYLMQEKLRLVKIKRIKKLTIFLNMTIVINVLEILIRYLDKGISPKCLKEQKMYPIQLVLKKLYCS